MYNMYVKQSPNLTLKSKQLNFTINAQNPGYLNHFSSFTKILEKRCWLDRFLMNRVLLQ